MPTNSTTNANIYLAFNTDTNAIPTQVKPAFLPIATPLQLGGVRPDGTTIVVNSSGVLTAVESGTGTVTRVDMTVPPAFKLTGNPITTQGVLALTWSTAADPAGIGYVPPANLGIGIASNTTFLRGDGSWNPILISIQVTGQPVITGAASLTAGSNITLTQSGNVITIASPGIAVDGVVVPSANNVVNFQDNTAAQFNRVLFNNPSTNVVNAQVDSTIPLVCPKITINNATSTHGVTFDYPNDASASYDLFFPAAQGESNTYLRNDGAGNLSWVVVSGGGTVFSAIVARWTTANSSTKNAYVSFPGTINNDGITINLTASSNPGVLSPATITLAGTALSGTFTVSGTFPNYTITIPQATLTGNVIETTATVSVGIAIGSQFILSANSLINLQPIAFNTVLSAIYATPVLPFYTTTATLNYRYDQTVGTITTYNGVITIIGDAARNATAASGSFTGVSIGGGSIVGNAVGSGLNGAGQSTVGLSGSVTAVTTYVPAFYIQTNNSPIPLFTTTSLQTPGGAVGSIINYPVATATTQYNWVATTRPLSNVFLITQFGNSVLVPDVTATQTLAGTLFNIFGWSSLTVGQFSRLTFT